MEIKIIGAKENNLKNISVEIPLNKITVITGLSGSGKSSLAFDTIHKEGQRRYLETFSTYARSFIGNFERPNVDHISGLSPVISIDQKAKSNNPRSTVGTTTEIYDYLRLLYAKVAEPVSFMTNKKMTKQDPKVILTTILNENKNNEILILTPIVKARKGHYNELFQSLIKKGYIKVRINNTITKLSPDLRLDRYKNHNIELIIDKLTIKKDSYNRLKDSLNLALQEGKGVLVIHNIKKNTYKYFSEYYNCSDFGISYENPEPNSFSFNSPKGYCQQCKGIGKIELIDLEKIITNPNLSIENGAIKPIGKYQNNWIFQQLKIIGKKYNFTLSTKFKDIKKEGVDAILYGLNDRFHINNKKIGVTQKFEVNFEGIVNFIEYEYNNNKSKKISRWAKDFFKTTKCKECNGQRLKKESLHFLIDNRNIADISNFDIYELRKWCLQSIEKTSNEKKKIAIEIIKELSKRLDFLINIGLGYITVARQTSSLSGGESQRIKIASQICSELTNVLYILDEPSIGLHPVDNQLLINSLNKLKKLGNSIIVVEHDKAMMEAADYIIDMGPGAGNRGGNITFQGSYKNLLKSKSLTGKHISSVSQLKKNSRKGNGNSIILKGAKGNNLKNINISIPLSQLTVITGVSGSGKSTLINGTLYPIISQKLYRSLQNPYSYKSIEGIQNIDKIINIDQSPIGRTPRSNPSTYIGLFDEIRKLYANLKESKIRGYSPGQFSFNLKKGTCKECEGNGYLTIQMKLLPDIETLCKNCNGKRFNNETLEIKYNNKNIYDVLNMDVDEDVTFFNKIPKIKNKLNALVAVGMGYIKLGQSSTKLSGGEAQRVKLASELSRKSTGQTLYILDEPTTGLHFYDIQILMKSINLLVDKGNTVIIIEHNLDIVQQADYIIDLGPKGGKDGGKIIFQGNMKDIVNIKNSQTGLFLKKEISSHDE
ncbi:MAG: excinuclease ABC subunit A [Flavobacteriales bacterium]|nr:excinuclease ABC subunit A [Flavobacteriales bacterium]